MSPDQPNKLRGERKGGAQQVGLAAWDFIFLYALLLTWHAILGGWVRGWLLGKKEGEDAQELFYFSFLSSPSAKDGVWLEPSSVLGGEIGSSEVRDGGCIPSRSVTQASEGHQAPWVGES